MIKEFIENRLIAAIRRNDVDAIERWLAVMLAGGKRELMAESWTLAFTKDQQSLVEIAIAESAKSLRQYKQSKSSDDLTRAQDCILSLDECLKRYTSFDKRTSDQKIPELRWYHRFFKWLKDTFSSATWEAKKDFDFTKESVDGKVKESLEEEAREAVERKAEAKKMADEEIMERLNKIKDGTVQNPLPEQISSYAKSYQEKRDPIALAQYQLGRDMGKKENKPGIEFPQTTSTSKSESLLAHWSSQLELVQQMNQDQQQQQQQQQNQSVDVMAELNLAPQVDIGVDMFADISELQSYQVVDKKLNMYSGWLRALMTAIHSSAYPNLDTYNVHRGGYVRFSTNALAVLVKGEAVLRYRGGGIPLDSLPLGFFLETVNEKDQKITVLKFSEKLRDYQLRTLPDAVLRCDPYVVQENPSKSWDETINSWKKRGGLQQLFQRMDEKAITLTYAQKSFLQKTGQRFQKEIIKAGYKNANGGSLTDEFKDYNPVVYALSDLLESANKDQFLAFLDILVKLNHKEYQCSFTDKKENLLDTFCIYLNSFDSTKKDGSAEQVALLQHLLKASDKELSLFYFMNTAVSHFNTCKFHSWSELQFQPSHTGGKIDNDPRTTQSFTEFMGGFNYFLGFFKRNGFPLPETKEEMEGLYRVSGFPRLKGILTCISLAENPAIQAKLMGSLPENLLDAQKLLRTGYCLAHKDMFLGTDSYGRSRGTLPSWVTQNELEKVSEPEHFQAYYLRYLACNVSAENFLKGLAKWESLIGDPRAFGYERAPWERHLNEKWDEVKRFALSFPTRMDNKQKQNAEPPIEHDKEEFEKKYELESYKTKCYSVEDLARLPLSQELKQEFQLEDAITKLNGKIEYYAKLDAKSLKDAAKSCKEGKLKNRDDLINALALLRELIYRNSKNKEWLRLEQVVVILLSVEGKGRLYEIGTGEGKTLTLQIIAILNALRGVKTDIITHNEVLADSSYAQIQPYVNFFELRASAKESSPDEICEADIHYMDIGRAVIADKWSELDPTEKPRRSAQAVLGDEIDNTIIDIHATTSMRLSRSEKEEADEHFVTFLNTLNEAVDSLIKVIKTANDDHTLENLNTQDKQREFIRQRLKDSPYYKEHCEKDNDELDMWIKAAFASSPEQEKGLKKDVDYIVKSKDSKDEKLYVQIVHKKTTGRVDTVSHWGNGVHQCVAARERKKELSDNPEVCIPAMSQVIAEGNVVSFFQKYPKRSGYTGTLGEEQVLNKMNKLLGSDMAEALRMPRAKKEAPANVHWPINTEVLAGQEQVMPAQYEQAKQYNRAIHFPPQVIQGGKDAYFRRILEGLKNAQGQDYSSLVFLNSIAECDEFAQFLQDNDIESGKIQILDDTNPTDESSAGTFRPSEATVISEAKKKGMITLTTAAGSRGTNFRDIDVAIITKPGLARVLQQEGGRIGRVTDPGVIYEIYAAEDLGGLPPAPKPGSAKPINISTNFRFFSAEYGRKEQEQQLKQIEHKAELSQFKEVLFQKYLKIRIKCPADKRDALEKAWLNFYNKVDKSWKTGRSADENKIKINTEFEDKVNAIVGSPDNQQSLKL